ncbi:UvrD-helicase domain-containing protein [Rossellomorea aquimaris]|uniref:UvrD-helicase domain-containing protein n=1 Tax=Rossellomorea aquimaris TaxID=189382 RepID=UPI001CD23AAC|nr:UvrD-helicase domain-containing protein [Rossellomorea aquimaris]MCA1056031.1 UvrD-helicase domain-containing protein [Rossellomorea aquimaris]
MKTVLTNYSIYPFEAEKKEIPSASLHKGQTSKDLVSPDDEDAFFFRKIEEAGILLNEAQIAAVRHGMGACLTLAGAGTGKTTVLVCRAGYLMDVKNIMPQNILLVTFTKKAADEMKQRINALPGIEGRGQGVQASTFHALFLYLLRSRHYTQEIIGNERYKQIILKQLQREMNIHDPYDAETLLAKLSHYKLNKLNISEMPDSSKSEKEIKNILIRYEEWKRRNHKMDFDDILTEAYELLDRNPNLLKSLQHRFQYVMVDEFQDTNLIQYELIKMIAAHGNLFVVGDDDQTIYSFNGARNEFILDFDQEFPDARIVTLNENYRSDAYIIGLGNEVIDRNEHRRHKRLIATKKEEKQPLYARPATADEEAVWVVKEIEQLVEEGYSYKDMTILHRTMSSGRAVFEQLLMKEIPFHPYSQKDSLFYENWTVKPVIDYLRLCIVPRNFDAIGNILPTMFIRREKGMEHILQEDAKVRKKYPLIHLTTMNGLKPFQVKNIKTRMKFIKSLQEVSPETAIKKIRKEFYHQYIDAQESHVVTEQKELIKEMLTELEGSAKRFDTISSFINFIDEMKAKYEDVYQNKSHDSNSVSLMTIHRSKGLEFPVVFLIGAIEGNLPHSSALNAGKLEDKVYKDAAHKERGALEEERRLAYVAITRAKERLFISSPSYYQGETRKCSRFISDLFSEEPHQDLPKSGGSREKRTGKLIVVEAWSCTSKHCIAWQRREAGETASDEKKCPMCSSSMELGEKEVYG